jgi:mono/diheme cytochrome c family protein
MIRRASSVAAAVALLGLTALALAQGGARMGRDLEAAHLPLDRWQPKALPALPSGITRAMIVAGDSIYRGKGGCVTCHGPDGYGMPNAGSGVTLGLNFIPTTVQAIDSLITAGVPEALSRSSVAMPGRGASQNLTAEETRRVAAYVWAIANVHAEPWPGGHRTHETQQAAGDTAGGTAAKAP